MEYLPFEFLLTRNEGSSRCGRGETSSDAALCLGRVSCATTRIVEVGHIQANHHVESSDDCKLFLGLGPMGSAHSDGFYKTMATEKVPSSALSSQLASGNASVVLELGLPRVSEDNECPEENDASVVNQCYGYMDGVRIPVVDEGSTSAKRVAGGYMQSLVLAPKLEANGSSSCCHRQFVPEPSVATVAVPTVLDPAMLRSVLEHPGNHSKKCRFDGCTKGARGASGLCIGHGGGQRCQKPGCNKGAESRTAYCKAHGGGRRCHHLGCTKSAEGKTDYCIAHGGGRRCGHPGCKKAARGKSGLCIRHGGGKRCKVEGCARSAEGQAGLCISHGGGRRCQHAGCTKGAQGSTMYCKAHGGGKRCAFAGCTKGAEGSTPLCKGHGGGKRCLYGGGGVCPKSIHGGTDYCVAHGGGKRCAVPGCTKSARGRTDCCVRHGGGKRCQVENCGKSAQGSTDFCKAHGGGKRCSWSGDTCEKFARGKSGLCAAHGSIAQDNGETAKGGLPRIMSTSTSGSTADLDYSSGVSAISDCNESVNVRNGCPVSPPIMKPSCNLMIGEGTGCGEVPCSQYVIPEGRVHGGGLMSLFGGNLKNAADML